MGHRRLVFGILLLFVSAALPAQPRRTTLLEISPLSDKEMLRMIPLFGEEGRQCVISHVRDRAFVLATPAEASLLAERFRGVSVVMTDTSARTLHRRAMYGPAMKLPPVYHTYDQIVAEGERLAREYPALIVKRQIGRTTQEGRPIVAFRISSDARTSLDRPRILFTGCHHADELMGAEISLALMRQLVEGYGKDPRVTEWLRRGEVFVVPVLNVDGHTVVTSGIDPRWRKNTRDGNRNGVLYEFPEGVDINRNYDFNWAHGGSDDPMSERYRGEYPFSESENRAMRALADDERFLAAITYHSQGEVIFYPWEWRGRKAPDDALLTSMARGLAGSIRTMKGDTCYKAEYGAGTVGQSYPWLYGRYGTFDFVIEVGLGASFFPPEEVPGIIAANLPGAHVALDWMNGPGLSIRVTDASSAKPLEARVWIPSVETEDVDRRTSHPATGRFWRLLPAGSYTVVVSRDGYGTVVLKDVRISTEGWTTHEVKLAGLN